MPSRSLVTAERLVPASTAGDPVVKRKLLPELMNPGVVVITAHPD
jgi:hypothetical protein